jgi:hypothetical protein
MVFFCNGRVEFERTKENSYYMKNNRTKQKVSYYLNRKTKKWQVRDEERNLLSSFPLFSDAKKYSLERVK